MPDPGTPEQEPDGEQYHLDPATLAVLEGLGQPRRPWQVLLTWTDADEPGPRLHKELGRILDLFPGVGCLTVHTAGGSIVASRDFRSNYAKEVNDILARLFRANRGVVGVTFPATSDRPAHTATPDNPFWSPLGQASAAITAAVEEGRITPEQAIEQLKRLYGADKGDAGTGAGDPASPAT